MLLIQGSYREVCVKFNDFSRTSQDFPTVFKDYNFRKILDLSAKILLRKC